LGRICIRIYAIYASKSRKSIVKYEAVEDARDRRKKQGIRSVVMEAVIHYLREEK
jgi:hypothetical protein